MFYSAIVMIFPRQGLHLPSLLLLHLMAFLVSCCARWEGMKQYSIHADCENKLFPSPDSTCMIGQFTNSQQFSIAGCAGLETFNHSGEYWAEEGVFF